MDKVEELRAGAEEEREGWAAANLERPRQKVRDKEDNVRQLERSVRRLVEWVAREAKVKEEVVNEVVKAGLEEMVEQKVKEEVEKAVGRKVTRAGGVAKGFFGRSDGGGHHAPAMGPRRHGCPPPHQPRPPPAGPPGESDLDSEYFDAPCASQIFGAGEVAVAG